VTGDSGEQQRLARVHAGEHSAFAEMFDEHVQVVHRYCARRSDDAAESEDLTSMVFLDAWRLRSRAVLVDGSWRPWLLAIARNVVRNANRSRRRHGAALERLHALPLSDADDHADEVAAKMDSTGAREELAAAVAQLTGKQRDVVELCLVEELSIAAAAQVLGVPEGTVKSRLADARARLRELLRSSEFSFWTDPDGAGGHQPLERHRGATAGRTVASWTP
jgi:RNA polymerase sigma-70 factor (ECF subfamily)